MKYGEPFRDAGHNLTDSYEGVRSDHPSEIEDNPAQSTDIEHTQALLGGCVLQDMDYLSTAALERKRDANAVTIWQESLHSIKDRHDFQLWYQLAASPSFQESIKNPYLINGKMVKVDSEILLEKIFEVGCDNQEFLDESAARLGSLSRSFSQKIAIRRSRNKQGLIVSDSPDTMPAESIARGVFTRLGYEYPGDVVRSSALEQAGAFEYSEGNERRYFYFQFRKQHAVHEFHFEDPRKLLVLARSLDEFMDDPIYVRGVSELAVASLEQQDGVKVDSRTAMDFLSSASYVMMMAVESAASKPGKKHKELQQINTILQSSRKTRTGDLMQPSLTGILQLANGLLPSINNYLPEQERLSKITQRTPEGYYDAFERILYVVNELSESWENGDDRQMLFDMSNMATSLVKHSAPRIKSSGGLLKGDLI